MIVDFSIENFASIREKQTLSFVAKKNIHHLDEYYTVSLGGHRLLKVALIYGANASGKTTVLKALDCLQQVVCTPKESKSEKIDVRPFLMDESSRSKNTVFELNFVQAGQIYYYSIEFNEACIVREVLKAGRRGKIIYSRHTDVEKQLSLVKWGTFEPLKEKRGLEALATNTLWNESVICGFMQTNMDQPVLRFVSDWFRSYLNSMISPNRNLTGFVIQHMTEGRIDSGRLLSILHKADFNISDIELKKDVWQAESGVPRLSFDSTHPFVRVASDGLSRVEMFRIKFEHMSQGSHYSDIEFEEESLGTQRYFGLAGMLYMLVANSTSLCLDELESSIHPELAKHFLLTFCVNAKHSQLIATTHNREFLNNKDIYRNDMIVFTEKDENAATTVYKLSDFKSDVVRDTTNILNAYSAGRLGAVPNLGDYYLNLDEDEGK